MHNSLLYLLTVLIWGSTWIAINYQLGEVAPQVSIFYRFAFAALIMFGYCRFKKYNLTFRLTQHVYLLLFGLCLFSGNYYFLYEAQTYINSALASIVFSTLLLFNIINTRIWFNTIIDKNVYIGGVIGLLGIVTLFWPSINDTQLSQNTLLGITLGLIGVIFASFGNMMSIKNVQQKIPLLPATAWGMLYGTLGMLVVIIIEGKTFSFVLNPYYIGSLLYLSLFGSVFAFTCYLTLLTRIGAHKASYANIMFPAVAVVISTLVEGFSWNLYVVVGLTLMLIGNVMVLIKPPKKADNGSFKYKVKGTAE
jgi:drug/metabolite transporter (DMT)-like permease